MTGCLLNNPYRAADAERNAYYTSFAEPPKSLDPAVAYSEDEYRILGLVCEPLLRYHYLARPYRLIPGTAAAMPRVQERNGNAVYTITLRRGVRYAPHPCFSPAAFEEDTSRFRAVNEFANRATRELTADDYVTQIKRLADPTLVPGCPILPVMEKYILGMDALAAALRRDVDQERAARRQAGGALYNAERDERERPIRPDLDRHPLLGARSKGRYEIELTIRGRYPQIEYWLAMPFFTPVPREALAFYGRPAMIKRNLTLARFPVGTGPFRLAVY